MHYTAIRSYTFRARELHRSRVEAAIALCFVTHWQSSRIRVNHRCSPRRSNVSYWMYRFLFRAAETLVPSSLPLSIDRHRPAWRSSTTSCRTCFRCSVVTSTLTGLWHAVTLIVRVMIHPASTQTSNQFSTSAGCISKSRRRPGWLTIPPATAARHNVFKASYHHIRALRHIRWCVDVDIARSIASSVVGSHRDYCHSVLCATTKANIAKFERVQNMLASVAAGSPRRSHIMPILADLHWLPVYERICFKIAIITFKAV